MIIVKNKAGIAGWVISSPGLEMYQRGNSGFIHFPATRLVHTTGRGAVRREQRQVKRALTREGSQRHHVISIKGNAW